MKPARILLIVVALVAGGLAAFLATRGNNPRTEQPEVAQAQIEVQTREQVLVAANAIGLGQRLTSDDVSWQDWPQGALQSGYITASAVPDAPQQVAGSVARFEFFPGEPIREAKLVNANQGYLSAVIGEGMRAVSVSVDPASASGGFIVPNDHVDVVLTTGGEYAETILSNVRVLAIGTRLGEKGATGAAANPEDPSSQVFVSEEIATLEVTPGQAETLLRAGSAGRLALVLRSVVDFADTSNSAVGASQTVKLIRYGQAQSVTSSAPANTAPPGTSVSALENPAAPATDQPLLPVIEVR